MRTLLPEPLAVLAAVAAELDTEEFRPLNQRYWEYRIMLSIENIGAGAALAPALSIEIQRPWYIGSGGIDGNQTQGLAHTKRAIDTSWVTLHGTTIDVIHATSTLDVCVITTIIRARGAAPPDLNLPYRIACSNGRLTTDTLNLTSAELSEKVVELHRAANI